MRRLAGPRCASLRAGLGLFAGHGARGGEVSLADAIARTLGDDPGIKIQQESVLNTEGLLQTAGGQFDWNFVAGLSDSHTIQPAYPFLGPFGVLTDEEGAANLGVVHEFRSGITVEPIASVSDLENNSTARTRAAYSDVAVQVTVPLLRGLGAASADALEQAARLGVEGQRAAARFAIESQVFAALSAYWNAQAARDSLAAIRDTAARGREIADVVESFTRSGIMDDGLRARARAQVADYDRQGVDAELAYLEARQVLGLTMGLSPEELSDAPSPAGALPLPPPGPPDASLAARFAAESLHHRGDYQALEKAVDQERVLERKAELDLRPQVDLSAQAGYAGGANSSGNRIGGAAQSLSENTAGPNGLLALSLAWPIENDVARGALVSQRAQLRIAQLSVTQTGQGIVSSALVSFAELQTALRDYGLASDATEKYRVAADSENAKVRRGQSSLSDLIQVEQSYIAARLAAISAQENCALSIARLRLVSGLLAVESAGELRFDLRQASELPSLSTPSDP